MLKGPDKFFCERCLRGCLDGAMGLSRDDEAKSNAALTLPTIKLYGSAVDEVFDTVRSVYGAARKNQNMKAGSIVYNMKTAKEKRRAWTQFGPH